MKAYSLLVIAVVSLLVSGLYAAHLYLLDGLDGWLYSIAFDEDTVYSKGYSDGLFRRVDAGMSESDLLRLLHAPMAESWVYRSTAASNTSHTVGFSGDVVTATLPGGRFSRIGQISAGMKKLDVLRCAGEPQEKFFGYSDSQHDHSYRVRVVALSHGIVVRKISYFYVD
jgi:hypothetical protein